MFVCSVSNFTRCARQDPVVIGGPLARIDAVTVLTAEGPVTAVMLTIEHAFCDGVSIAVATQLLLTLLAQPSSAMAALTTTVWPAAFEPSCAPKGWFPLLKKMGRIKKMLAFGRPSGSAQFPSLNPTATTYQLAQTAHVDVIHVDVPVGEFAALKSLCKRHHTTVTGAVTAAILQGCAVVLPQCSTSDAVGINTADGSVLVSIACGADTRKLYRPPLPGDALCYHVSGVATWAHSLPAVIHTRIILTCTVILTSVCHRSLGMTQDHDCGRLRRK
jgi:hypothetical protein